MLLVGVAVWINGGSACAATHTYIEQFIIRKITKIVGAHRKNPVTHFQLANI